MEMKEPIYKVIERDLRKDILNGTLKQGDMIPSEIELCAKYGVARMTVRHAVDNLLIDGYIYRHKGRGTFVVFNKQEMDQNKQVPFFSFSREMIAFFDGMCYDAIRNLFREGFLWLFADATRILNAFLTVWTIARKKLKMYSFVVVDELDIIWHETFVPWECR